MPPSHRFSSTLILTYVVLLLQACTGWLSVSTVHRLGGQRVSRHQAPVTLQGRRLARPPLLCQQQPQPDELSELADILNPSDLAQVQARLRRLAGLFPGIEATELGKLVHISPLLLFVETAQVEAALSRLKREVSYVDPSYLLQQRAPGLELLLSLGAPSFNLTSSLRDVVRVAGPACNVTQLVRRAPQVLTPRYLLAMSDVVGALGRRVSVGGCARC